MKMMMIGLAIALGATTDMGASGATAAVVEQDRNPGSIPFSMKNRSLLAKRVEINGNILRFGPREVRYVGFPAGTKVYRYDAHAPDKRGKLLFTVRAEDRDQRFTV